MKNIFKYVIILLLAITFLACSDEPPSVRVHNQRPTKANVQIKTVNNTININDVQPGTITGFREVPKGLVEVSAEIQNVTDEPTESFQAENNYNYTIVLVNSTPVSIRIDREDK